MANARALDKRRKSIRNIRKITRTMELIATARYKKAMDRAAAATAYTDQITKIVALGGRGLEVTHPLLEVREQTVDRDCWCWPAIADYVRRLQRRRVADRRPLIRE
jgi:F0F1-type ATP synthase gamma subunit